MDRIFENRAQCSLSNSPEERSPHLLRGLISKPSPSGSESFILQLLLMGFFGEVLGVLYPMLCRVKQIGFQPLGFKHEPSMLDISKLFGK